MIQIMKFNRFFLAAVICIVTLKALITLIINRVLLK